MTASRNRRLAAGLFLICFGFSAAALAQSTGPKVLRPAPALPDAPQPVNRSEQAPPLPAPPGIQINILAAPGPIAAGILGPENGGLTPELWEGSERATIALLMDRLPTRFVSPTARDLARMTLLSIGRMPDGEPDNVTMSVKRMVIALNLGDAESVIALAESAGGVGAPEAIVGLLAEAQFSLGKSGQACDTVRTQLGQSNASYWRQASVFCDIRINRPQEAELTLTLLQETGQVDPVFIDLANALLEKKPVAIRASRDMSALYGEMAAASLSGAVEKPDAAPTHVAIRLTSASALTPESRIAAGLSAIRRAGITPNAVLLLFRNSDESAGAPFRKPLISALSATSTSLQAEAVIDLWQASARPEDQAIGAGFARDFVNRIRPAANMAFMAPTAFRISLLNGDSAQALAWLAVMRRAASFGDTPLTETARALALARLAGIADSEDSLLTPWIETAAGANEGALLTAMILLDGLGDPVDAATWRKLLAAARPAPRLGGHPALLRQMTVAADAGRTGEALLAALALIGDGAASAMDTVTLGAVVGVLRRLGREGEARRLAIEAVIGQGG